MHAKGRVKLFANTRATLHSVYGSRAVNFIRFSCLFIMDPPKKPKRDLSKSKVSSSTDHTPPTPTPPRECPTPAPAAEETGGESPPIDLWVTYRYQREEDGRVSRRVSRPGAVDETTDVTPASERQRDCSTPTPLPSSSTPEQESPPMYLDQREWDEECEALRKGAKPEDAVYRAALRRSRCDWDIESPDRCDSPPPALERKCAAEHHAVAKEGPPTPTHSDDEEMKDLPKLKLKPKTKELPMPPARQPLVSPSFLHV